MPDPDSFSSSRWVEQLDRERLWLRRFARSQLRGQQTDIDSEDLVQEAHCQGLAQRSRLRFSDRRNLRAWLALVVRNLVRDRHRRRTPEPWAPAGSAGPVGHATSPTGHIWRHELRRSVKDGLDQLSECDAAVVTLRIWDERSFKEIGSALDLSEGNARIRFHRAMERLKTNLRSVSPKQE